MLRSLFQSLSLLCFAAATIAAVLDLTRSIADSEWVATPFIEDWRAISPGSLETVSSWVDRNLYGFVWDPLLLTMLSAPTWVAFAVLALIFAMASRRRRSRWQENFGA